MTINRVCLAASLCLLWAYLFTMEEISPLFFLHDDNASSYISGFLLSFDTLFNTGRLAEINYYQYGGTPFMEQGQSAVLYPPSYLCVALAKYITGDPRWTIEWMMMVHLTIGQIGLFLLLQSWRVDPLLASVGGLLWTLCPFVIILSSNWVAVVYIVSYTPWILLAIDMLLKRPNLKASWLLAIPISLFILTGAVQVLAYVLLFTGLYGAWFFWDRSLKVKVWVLIFGFLSFIITTATVMPMLCPVFHASSVAAIRGGAMPLGEALQRSVDPSELFKTQFLMFGNKSLYHGPSYASSSYFLCIEVFLLPLAAMALFKARLPMIVRGMRLLCLAELALLFSTHGHVFLSLLPVFDRFRWPFKVFIFWKLFFILFILVGLSCWLKKKNDSSRKHLLLVGVLLAIVLIANWIIIALNQFQSLLSHAQLPTLSTDVASVIDPLSGRVMAVGNFSKDGYDLDRYLAYNFSTTYRIPNLAGYDSLIGKNQSDFGLGINIPNVYYFAIKPDVREQINKKCVRYLILDMDTPNGQYASRLEGIKPISLSGSRLIALNTQAEDMAVYLNSSIQPGPLKYIGNSLFVSLRNVAGSLGVSLSNTDGWYYRCDHGIWKRPDYSGNRVWCFVSSTDHELEISYFDPYFRNGIFDSILIFFCLGVGYLLGLVANVK